MSLMRGGCRVLSLCLAIALGVAACASPESPGGEVIEDADRVRATAETEDEIVDVALSDAQPGEPGTINYEVVVTWRGEAGATLEDARFTHHVPGSDGDLVLAGRGCGATWEEGEEKVTFPCTMDLETINLRAGQAHEYPVRIHTKVGPLALTPGTYVADETIGWQAGSESGEFTVTLTFVVQ